MPFGQPRAGPDVEAPVTLIFLRSEDSLPEALLCLLMLWSGLIFAIIPAAAGLVGVGSYRYDDPVFVYSCSVIYFIQIMYLKKILVIARARILALTGVVGRVSLVLSKVSTTCRAGGQNLELRSLP